MHESFSPSADIVELLEIREANEVGSLPSPAEGLVLISAFLRIKDPARRRAIIGLVKKAAQH